MKPSAQKCSSWPVSSKNEQEREAGLPTIRSRTQSQRNTRAKRGEARGTRHEQGQEREAEQIPPAIFISFSLPIRSFHAHESLVLPTEHLIGPPSAALRQWSSRGGAIRRYISSHSLNPPIRPPHAPGSLQLPSERLIGRRLPPMVIKGAELSAAPFCHVMASLQEILKGNTHQHLPQGSPTSRGPRAVQPTTGILAGRTVT